MSIRFNGIDQIASCDVVATTDSRGESTFSRGNYNYRFGGSGFTSSKGQKILSYTSGYLYSKNGLSGLRYNGSEISASAKGHRPIYTRRYETTTTGDLYLNKFSDGEIYVSSTKGSRTGTKLLSGYNCMYALMCGGGGGGSASTGNATGCGGGGAGLAFVCVPIEEYSSADYSQLHIGAGGKGGASAGASGGNGDNTEIYRYFNNYSIDWYVRTGGGFGGSLSSGGVGGDRGTGNGGVIITSSHGGAGGVYEQNGNPNASRITTVSSYGPDTVPSNINFSGGGGAKNIGGGGGGSIGNGGSGGGAYETGWPGAVGGGGGGAPYVWFQFRNGGNGGDGRITLYY